VISVIRSFTPEDRKTQWPSYMEQVMEKAASKTC
jgi:hypothetical protein